MISVGIFIAIAPKIIWGIPHYYEFPEVESVFSMGNTIITYYWRSDPHWVSYAFGMFCGYLTRQKPDLYFGGRIGELFLWLTSFSLTLYSLYWVNDMWYPYYVLKTNEIVLFLAFCKLMYLCGWFWMIYACTTGRGGMTSHRIYNSFIQLICA